MIVHFILSNRANPIFMTRFFIILLIAGLALNFKQSDKEFVCLPCGQECDNKVYKEAGTCSVCMMKLVEKSSVRYKNLTTNEFCSRINENPKVVILDVRSPEEFKGTRKDAPSFGHFKDAININVTELESRVGELAKYKDSEVLVYCSHSHRSPRASYFLGTQGFKNVKNMSGGVSTLNKDDGNACLKKTFAFHSY